MSIECEICGLSSGDLPDDVDPEDMFFAMIGGGYQCIVHDGGDS
jgi:hypothetical protein